MRQRRSSVNSLAKWLVLLSCLLHCAVSQEDDELITNMETDSTLLSSESTSSSTINTPSTIRPPLTTTSVYNKTPFYGNIKYTLSFSIAFDNVNSALDNCTSEAYARCSQEVKLLVARAFAGCPGYFDNSVTSLRFDATLLARTLKQSSFVEQGDRLYARYTAYFAGNFFFLNSPADIFAYIQGPVLSALTSSTLLGNSVDAAYTTAATTADLTQQSSTWLQNPCQNNLDVCDQCYICKGDYNTLTCTPRCSIEANEFCQTLSNQATVCSCKPNYLPDPASGKCVNQDLIIGLTAGLVGAFVVALIVVIIVLLYKLYWSSGNSSSKPTSSKSLRSLRSVSPLESKPVKDVESQGVNDVAAYGVQSAVSQIVEDVGTYDTSEKDDESQDGEDVANHDVQTQPVSRNNETDVTSPEVAGDVTVVEVEAQLETIDDVASVDIEAAAEQSAEPVPPPRNKTPETTESAQSAVARPKTGDSKALPSVDI